MASPSLMVGENVKCEVFIMLIIRAISVDDLCLLLQRPPLNWLGCFNVPFCL